MGSTTFRLRAQDRRPGRRLRRPSPRAGRARTRFASCRRSAAAPASGAAAVSGKPFFRISSATAWTTLALTIGIDGTSFHELVGRARSRATGSTTSTGASPRSRARSTSSPGTARRTATTRPGETRSPTFVTAAESALERQISRDLLTTGIDFERRTLEPEDTLVEQGEPGGDLYLLLDGVLAVIVDGDEVAEIGPGAIVGERASLENGTRTATLSARTRCRVAVIPAKLVDRQELEDLAATRGR